jgi:hypothetical protein
MNKWLLCLMFLLISVSAFAQKNKDSLVNNMPVIDGKLTYTDSITVKDRNGVVLDSLAKKWFNGYFKYHWTDSLTNGQNAPGSVLSKAILEFRASPNSYKIVYYNYIVLITIKIDCKEGYYTYKISDVYFRPKNGFLNKVVIHPASADKVLDDYKKKNYSFWHIDGATLRNYLNCIDTSIRNCIASLNTAMTN